MTAEDVRLKWRERDGAVAPGLWPVHWLTLLDVVRDPAGRIVIARKLSQTDCGIPLPEIDPRDLAGLSTPVTCGDCLSGAAAPEVEATLRIVEGTYTRTPSPASGRLVRAA